jgi:two-component system, NarL family, nitrate/nitrite response regulator NarL
LRSVPAMRRGFKAPQLREVELTGPYFHNAETEQQLLQCVRCERPEVLVLGPFATENDDLELLNVVRAVSSMTKTLVILPAFDAARLLRAIQRGAWGYFSATTTPPEFLKAIQAIRRGELWVERALLRTLLIQGVQDCNSPALLNGFPEIGDARFKLLRPREREIANLVAAGASKKRIASKLNITESTVKAHLVNIFRKFDIHHRMELAAFLHDREGG